jgi:recombination protein RecA
MSDDLREFLANARTAATGSARVLSLDELGQRGGAPANAEPWGLGALRGRFVELSARGASATMTAAIGLVIEAQVESEPVAWITHAASTFYPPDAAQSGVDLAALVVVRVPDLAVAPRAAERLLRSGAFGLVVLDLGGNANVDFPMAHQGRLVTLAQAHDAAVVCITDKTEDTGSIGSLISLRAEALRTGMLGALDGFDLTLRVLKDKRRGPGWTRAIKVRGPAGT